MKMWSEPLREFKNIEVVGCMQQNVSVALLQDMKTNVASKRMIHDEKVVKIKVKRNTRMFDCIVKQLI